MTKAVQLKSVAICLIVGSMIAAAGCGKKDPAAADNSNDLTSTLTGMSQIPSVSEMAKANSPSSAAASAARISFLPDPAAVAKVSGSAPQITSLGSSNVDTYFYNGLLAKINDAGWAAGALASKQADANAFWGQVDGGPSGQGGCMMVANLAQSFGRMLEGATSTCYMKGIPRAASGVTISSGNADNLFAQGAQDKLVKVAVQNMLQNNGGQPQSVSMDVFIRVFGTSSAGANIYKAKLYMCPSPNAAPQQEETLIVDKSQGSFSDISYNTQQGQSGYSKVTAYLKNQSGAITFDLSKDRVASSFYDGTWGKFKSDVTLSSANQITTKSYSSSSWGSDKNFSISSFSGDSLRNLTFLEGGFNGLNTCATCGNGGSSSTHAYSGGIEFHDTFYAAVSSNSLATQAAAEVIGSDNFFSDLTVPTIDYSVDSCGATADVTVTADFSDAALQAVQTKCEGEKDILGQSIWQMCDSSQNAALQSAMNKIFQMYQ